MSKDEIILLCIGSYLLVAAVTAGVMRELDGFWDEDHWWCLLWPVLVAIGVPWGAGWLLSWLGRAPVLLARRLQQPRIPRAVVQEEP